MAEMKNFYDASVNGNGDLIVVIDNVICQRVDKASQKAKFDDWFADLVVRLESTENPRTETPYGAFDVAALKKAVKAALK